MTAPDPDLVAAIDLGSNSFHMIIARLDEGEPKVIDRIREQVKLASGFDDDNNLTREAQETALACLRRFGERLQNLSEDRVRAVGTNTLRKAANSEVFIELATLALGHPIEVISGQEEARVLYLGVAQSLSGDTGRRLVVDIGGGSTECIIGQGTEPQVKESMHMGCVSYTLRYFGNGKITTEQFKEATLAARVELEPIERRYRSVGWERAVGASGTIKSIESILVQNGWSEGGITRDGMRQLRKAMIACKSINKLTIPGLTEERASVIPGGLAILYGVFRSLKIERMTASQGALREGLLYELIGRFQNEDTRERTVSALGQRFGIDAEQAARVEQTALSALDQVAGGWDLMAPKYRNFLSWAARLHEIGLIVSYTGYHRHGGYLLGNTDLPGFSRNHQRLLANLVRAHRRRLHNETLEELMSVSDVAGPRMAILLRLAVALNRARSPQVPEFEIIGDESGYELRLPEAYLAEHPMTAEDFAQEGGFLKSAGFTLTLV